MSFSHTEKTSINYSEDGTEFGNSINAGICEFRFSKDDTSVIKGIAVAMMVFHHLFSFQDYIKAETLFDFEISGYYLSYWIGLVFRLCVSIFTFLGGYGLYLG